MIRGKHRGPELQVPQVGEKKKEDPAQERKTNEFREQIKRQNGLKENSTDTTR